MSRSPALPLLPRCSEYYSGFGLLTDASELSYHIWAKRVLVKLAASLNTDEEQKENNPYQDFYIGSRISPINMGKAINQTLEEGDLFNFKNYSVGKSELNKICRDIEIELLELMGRKEWYQINNDLEIENAAREYEILLKKKWPPMDLDEEQILAQELGNGWFPEEIVEDFFCSYLVKTSDNTYRICLEGQNLNGIEKLENNIEKLLKKKVKIIGIDKNDEEGYVLPWAEVLIEKPEEFKLLADILIQWLEIKDRYLSIDYCTRILRESSILGSIDMPELFENVPEMEDTAVLFLKCGGISEIVKGGIYGYPEEKRTESPYINKSVVESAYYYPVALPYLNYVSTANPRDKFFRLLQLTEKVMALVALFACSLVYHNSYLELKLAFDSK